MKHINKTNLVLAFALILSLAFGPTSFTAAAKPEQPVIANTIAIAAPVEPDQPCIYSIKSSLVGTVPLTITVEAPQDGRHVTSRTWTWGDGSETDTKAYVSHTYNAISDFEFTYHETHADGTYCSSTGDVSVRENLVDQTDSDDSGDEKGDDNNIPSSDTTAADSGCPSTIIGDNNTVICGNTDMNNTNVTNGEKPAQPILNQTFGQIIGQAFADLIRSFIK